MTLEPGKYLWLTPSRDKVVIDDRTITVLAAIERVFPGAKAKAYRIPPAVEWVRP